MPALTRLALLAITAFAVPVAMAGPEAVAATVPDPEVTSLVARVEAAYAQIQVLEAEFEQVSRSAAMGEGPVQRGRLVLKRPNKMRWDFTTPDNRLFVTNGERMWVYAPADKQVIVYKDLAATGGGFGASLLADLDHLGEQFHIRRLPFEGDAVQLEATPKSTQAGFKQLRLLFDPQSWLLRQVTLVDAFDNETVIRFSAVRVNGAVADERFQFEPPAGVQVVQADGG